MERKLKRSRTNKVIGGVCGGVGEYFDIDPVFIRIIAVILAFASGGGGVLAYIIAMVIMPNNEVEFHVNENGDTVQVEDTPKDYSLWNKYIPGIILIGIGIVWLIPEHFTLNIWDEFWPALLIIGGLFLIIRRKDKSQEDIIEPTVEVPNPNSKHEDGGPTL